MSNISHLFFPVYSRRGFKNWRKRKHWKRKKTFIRLPLNLVWAKLVNPKQWSVVVSKRLFHCVSLSLLSLTINQGLTLDDRSSTYDQIERSQNHGPYQDVCNTLHDDIQLEKPWATSPQYTVADFFVWYSFFNKSLHFYSLIVFMLQFKICIIKSFV